MPSAWGCLLSRTALRFRAISDARSPPPWICPWHDRYLAPGAVRRDQGAAGGLELGLLSRQLFSWHPALPPRAAGLGVGDGRVQCRRPPDLQPAEIGRAHV